ncbi:MAG: 16S rRNA (guanine(527)-N(7))-methyltransferase RsmG [Bacteroidetes bacterium]|nr:MAG: 16S rRNA (guanine(527)-N(7))-methyltransferase RsmG [Bacteroidota bacterium]
MNILQKYFPDLTAIQCQQFEKLPALYQEWNEKINVISRKDIEELMERHVLHALAIAKVTLFKSGANIMDLGTGGGFPGIPLAIMFPEANFLLVDSIGKKIKVAQAVIEALELKNVQAVHERAEKIDDEFDFVVSRAVAPLSDLANWCNKKFLKMYNHKYKNGIFCLKGGDLKEELKPFGKDVKTWDINDFFEEEFFNEKKVVYLKMI